MRRPVGLLCLLLPALLWGCLNVGLAQNDGHRFNYSFATLLGSGVYDLSGRIIQVYRIPISHSFRDLEGHRYGLNLQVPVTFGLFDFNREDVAGSGLPDDIGTVTVVPLLEVPVRILPNWYLAPKAGFGAGKDFDGGDWTTIYQVAVKSVVSFPGNRFDTTVWNELAYIGHTVPEPDPNEDLAAFESGLEFRRRLRRTFRGHGLDVGFFVANYLYTEPTEYFLIEDMSFEVKDQYEIGFTIGTRDKAKLWRIPLPRVGLSYRFGDGVSAVRFVLGGPF
jgi:hypothetical protein